MSLKSLINKLFTKHLMVTNCVGLCGCLAVGDFIEQSFAARIRGNNDPTDFSRVGRMSASGVPVACVDTLWYKWLDKRFMGSSTKVAIKKVSLDLVIGAPLINVIWLSTIELLEGKSISEALKNSISKLPIVILGEICFFIPAQFFNFKFVPPRYRVIYLAVISTAWVVFLSFVQHDLKGHLHKRHKDNDASQ